MNNEELKDLSFEDALLQLENIVRELESGRIKLDDAVSAYEKAVANKASLRPLVFPRRREVKTRWAACR